jgi:hypothetical protein
MDAAMLDTLQHTVREAFRMTREVILATDGAAGILAQRFPAEGRELRIYLLVPATSDHLYNLEGCAKLALAAENWDLTGSGRILEVDEAAEDLGLLKTANVHWSRILEVEPQRMHLYRKENQAVEETIDF